MAIRLFKIPGYNVFNYQPRYYDPEKEKRDKRRRELRIEKGKSPDIDIPEIESPIRGSFTYRISRKQKRANYARIRFFIIFAFLLFFAYLLLIADLTPLVELFSK
ncbi:MAG TPA: hypothetical protein PLO05_07385 [Bacteroidales bacterium]|jgi:hypothetical protein|nr:hypothetical protein [Bacteroidales bacterium]MDD4235851.1 hypothetical protein [Bacteroidales bacterium]HXK81962.1 hypothetical protein [Bacteroidales bacterium]